ncbi:AAA-ATPase At5g17760-like [Gastrolobium bilobum]|uniref:AAA-ATPase At5g17760-like n=1 Tax=Gastrolobium bilobum TaxID=150636 RepID=UPI002AB1DB45|nr:AAA-ATPase At5g17760-like [Gastrolobium bilobum]
MMIFFPKDMTSPSSIFKAYASMSASIMLLRSMFNEFVPQPVRGHLSNAFRYLIKPRSPTLTLVIEESSGIARNQVYDAAEAYLSTKVSPANERLRISKSPKEKNLTIRLESGEKLTDSYEGVSLKWRFNCAESEKNNSPDDYGSISIRSVKRYFELSFNKKHKEMVLESYLPFILEKAKEMRDEERVLKIHTLNTSNYGYSGVKWDSVNLEHPSTFETLAMESELKNAVIEDLNRFVKRRDFYKKVGRAWKRGYLLYGPPGTGKSSLIAAMANHLKFDIFDLQLGNIRKDSDLRKLLLATANRSILVIEDIDCSVDLPERRHGDGREQADGQDKAIDGWKQLTLSGLLNFIDGLWSSCGEERIIVFTTNHKERLDPALLRPGRMDMHIHMSYCTYQGFKLLASNYLEISSDHRLFGEIEGLIEETRITPAQVAEELMKSEDAEESLEGFMKLLKRKKMEGDVFESYSQDKAETHQQSKRRKAAAKTSCWDQQEK